VKEQVMACMSVREFFSAVKNRLIGSTIVHLHQDLAADAHELIALIDRFLDKKPRYDLEWDDFISWKNDNPQVEQVRLKIGEFEPLLFSKRKEDKLRYRNIVIEERNRLAALLGVPTREPMTELP
jgi:hypothetical protein